MASSRFPSSCGRSYSASPLAKAEHSPAVVAFLEAADEKPERIVRAHLGSVAEAPYPGSGRGKKEGLPIDGTERYRIHISQTWLAFYDIYEDDDEVGVFEIVSIDEAHKRYGY